MYKFANILDYVRKELDPTIWDFSDGGVLSLHDSVRDQILDVAESLIDDLELPSETLKGVYLYGSILTNQYNKSSDLDCRIVLDPALTKQRYPNLTGDNLFDLAYEHLQNIPINGTDHVLNCTVVIEGEETLLGQSELGKTVKNPVYDVLQGRFIVAPVYEKEFDPDKEFEKEINESKLVMSKLDKLLQETRIDTIDFAMLKEAIGEVNNPDELIRKLQEKLEEIETDAQKLIEEYEDLKEQRTDSYKSDGHIGLGNIIYKVLEKYGYLRILQMVTYLFKDGIEKEEVGELEKIVSIGKKIIALNIDKSKLYTLWYEDKDGKKLPLNLSKEPYDLQEERPKGFDIQVSRFPNEITTTYLKINEDGTSSELMTGHSTFPEDLVVKMVESGDFELGEVMIAASEACERCLNVLCYEYGLDDGYPEHSEQWEKSHTRCDFCKEEQK